jgi:hypothetical protein
MVLMERSLDEALDTEDNGRVEPASAQTPDLFFRFLSCTLAIVRQVGKSARVRHTRFEFLRRFFSSGFVAAAQNGEGPTLRRGIRNASD